MPMSGRSTNALFLLWVTRRLTRTASARPRGPVGKLLRMAMLLVVLNLFGPLLWHALWTMPTGLAVLVGSAIVIRIGRWYWLRGR